MSEAEFEQFAEHFHQDISAHSRDTETEAFAEEEFTDLLLGYLADAGEIDDHEICSHQARGIKVNGYSFSNNNEALDLFVSLYTGEYPPIRVSRTDLQIQLKRLRTFFDRALNRNYTSLEESSPAFDLADRIHQLRGKLTIVRLFVLTDGVTNIDTIEDDITGPIRISHHIWDIQRLHRLASSGIHTEPIEIDLFEAVGKSLPCLPMPEENPVYSTYLCIVPANALADLYGIYGPRLLERNVRAFLQMRGAINKGIRDTIINQPHMFLAFNNGISATAESVELTQAEDGSTAIRRIRDFQIVNGGQTTASIYHTRTKDKKDISKVFVQVKLTVLKDPEDIDSIVPKISEYANSQNKINAADFTSNDPFHITLQKLSRKIWAPAKPGSQLETHWYYERVRGQYQDDKGRKISSKQQKVFGEQNPPGQRFTKTELAKYENSWDQLPHLVSLGAEKNYREFVLRYHEAGEFVPDGSYFSLVISKAILFRQTDKIIGGLKYGGYKAQIVTYTVALLSNLTGQRINLEKIWKAQGLSPALESAVVDLSRIVHAHITSPPGGKNITEWCKRDECWKALLRKKVNLPDCLTGELVDESTLRSRDIRLRQKDENERSSEADRVESTEQGHAPGSTAGQSAHERYIRQLTPQKWSALIRDATSAKAFTEGQIALLRRMQKMSGRNMRPKSDQIRQVNEILRRLAVDLDVDGTDLS